MGISVQTWKFDRPHYKSIPRWRNLDFSAACTQAHREPTVHLSNYPRGLRAHPGEGTWTRLPSYNLMVSLIFQSTRLSINGPFADTSADKSKLVERHHVVCLLSSVRRMCNVELCGRLS